jgi:phosphate transport system substrate-binding protein
MKLTPIGKLLLFLIGLGLVATAALRVLPKEARSWDGLLQHLRGGPSSPPATAPAPSTPANASRATTVPVAAAALRLHGSNTIGKDLAPALAERYLTSLGASGIHRVATGEDEVRVEGDVPGTGVFAIEIRAHGSSTAFEDLLSGAADIGMASRRIKPDERARLAGLGDLTSAASEHVLGLDGLAVIVPASSALDTVSLDQLRDIFGGRITDWSAVGGAAGPVHIAARDDKSGTFDTFKTLVLQGDALAPGSRRFEDSRELSRAVASDPAAIGFVGLAYVGDCRALKIAERGAVAYRPTVFTVRTEDYALSRRLYLYTASAPRSADIGRFVAFALSDQGQSIVDAMGFVGQSLNGARQEAAAPAGGEVPAEYARQTRGAERLPLDFRFESGSDRLDNKALRDVGRLLESLTRPERRGKQVLLFGFADGLGAAETNLRLSKARADAVGEELRAEGIHAGLVLGFGSAMPVAANDTDAGRGRNRRVEVWLR